MSSRCILCEGPAIAEIDICCGAFVEVCEVHVLPYAEKRPWAVIPLVEVASA